MCTLVCSVHGEAAGRGLCLPHGRHGGEGEAEARREATERPGETLLPAADSDGERGGKRQ